MSKLSAIFIFSGFLLTFGAVGGMENPDQAEYFLYQLASAFVGLFLMFMGAIMIPQDAK
jgi:hypothetical protein